MNWISVVWHALSDTSIWMAWNLFLALVPLALSVWLFRLAPNRSISWWVGFFLFIAFLPNAPYVLTDLIHLVADIQRNNSSVLNTLVILPKYLLFVLIGFEAYVLCLINLGVYFKRQNLGDWVTQAELILHALSAIGIYLGRVERFNSWDIMTRPHYVIYSLAESLLDKGPLIFMVIALSAIAALYWLLKQLTMAVLLQRRYSKALNRLSTQADTSEVNL